MSDPQQFPPAPTAAAAVPPPYGIAPQASAPSGSLYPNGTAQPEYPAPARGGSSGVARVAFILAIISVALSAVSSIARVVLYTQMNRFRLSLHIVDGFNIGSNLLLFGCSAAAFALGIVAARGERKLMAGIAIGVGSVGVVSLAIGFLLSMLTPLLYG